MIELRRPTQDLVEDYLLQVFENVNISLEKTDKFKVFAGRQSGGGFIRFLDKEYNAIMNLYASEIQTVSKASTTKYQHDTVKFYIDVLVATNTKENKLWNKEGISQDEAAHKAIMIYSDLARNILCDLSFRNFGLKQGVVGNFRFNGVSNFDVEYREEEITMLGARIDFTLDMPYFPYDSKEYAELKEIFISLGKNLGVEIKGEQQNGSNI